MKIAVVGGGPAGLYFARLMKRHFEDAVIDVYEQNPSGATFGFGIGLGARALDLVQAEDPWLHARLRERMLFKNQQTITLNDESIVLSYAETGGTIKRLTLLEVLREGCIDCGVRVHFDQRIAGVDDVAGADLIVGSDGANSIVRNRFSTHFGTRTEQLTNHFAWYGLDIAKPSGLTFRQTSDGVYVGHFYTYAPDKSTFVTECDHATWIAAGLENMPDAERKAHMERVFGPDLGGATFVENRSIWRTFGVITNQNWVHGRHVIIGDALYSAHFSIGSGTRLAMEDAIALFGAFRSCGNDIDAALAEFVRRRRPVRDKFSDAARKSYLWYENVRTAVEAPLMDFVYDFLTRTGRVDDTRLKSYAPNFYEAYRAYRALPA